MSMEAILADEERRRLQEACEAERENGIIFTHIAQALARGYTDLYYVNMETDELIEYHTDDERGVLTEARRGSDFFEGCERDAKHYVHPDDQEAFVTAMNRDFLTEALDRSKVFELTYRRILDGGAFYVRMRVSRIEDDKRFIVIAVSDIDELMKRRFEEEKIQEERIIYARLHALTGNFIVVYVVDPETDSYREFSSTDDYTESFAQAKVGTDFFNVVRDVAKRYNHPEDLSRFLAVFTKENVMAEVRRSGIFTFGYRLIMEGRPVHVQMKAAMVEEKEGPRLIVGLNDIDAQYRQQRERAVFVERDAHRQHHHKTGKGGQHSHHRTYVFSRDEGCDAVMCRDRVQQDGQQRCKQSEDARGDRLADDIFHERALYRCAPRLK